MAFFFISYEAEAGKNSDIRAEAKAQEMIDTYYDSVEEKMKILPEYSMLCIADDMKDALGKYEAVVEAVNGKLGLSGDEAVKAGKVMVLPFEMTSFYFVSDQEG